MIKVGVDIGATHIKIAVKLDDLKFHFKGKKAFGYAIISIATNDDFRLAGCEVYKAICDNFGVPSVIGICCFGPLDLATKTILESPNKPSWKNQSFILWEVLFSCPCVLDNDANIAGYGEAVAGAGQGYRRVSAITLGGGIGNALIVRNPQTNLMEIEHGCHDIEGGHMCLDPNGPLCGCGGKGCVESYISTAAIIKKFGAEPKELAGRQDVWKYYATYLGRMCQIISTAVNPDIIVICGGVAKEPYLILKTRQVRDNLAPIYKKTKKPLIVRGELVPHTGAIGAVLLANVVPT